MKKWKYKNLTTLLKSATGENSTLPPSHRNAVPRKCSMYVKCVHNHDDQQDILYRYLCTWPYIARGRWHGPSPRTLKCSGRKTHPLIHWYYFTCKFFREIFGFWCTWILSYYIIYSVTNNTNNNFLMFVYLSNLEFHGTLLIPWYLILR